jgi:hypothetical protein
VRLFQDRIKNGAEVAGRRIDELEDFGGGGLLLQRLVALGKCLSEPTL